MLDYLKEVPELYEFVTGLHWSYLIVLIITMYGIKHTQELDWFVDLMKKARMEKVSKWVAAIIVGGFFCLFTGLDPDLTLDSKYVSDMLRTMFFGIIFNSIFVEWPIKYMKNKFNSNEKKDEK